MQHAHEAISVQGEVPAPQLSTSHREHPPTNLFLLVDHGKWLSVQAFKKSDWEMVTEKIAFLWHETTLP